MSDQKVSQKLPVKSRLRRRIEVGAEILAVVSAIGAAIVELFEVVTSYRNGAPAEDKD